jgi:AcrR family transcriptional regulator
VTADTKDQILDAAERLFAQNGIDSVSLRTITQEAGVNLAAVNYHFGSKEALVTEVFARRVGQVNGERLRLLGEYEQRTGDGHLEVEEVLRTFIAPAIRLSHELEHGEMVMQLCSRIYTESQDYVGDMFDKLFQEILERYGVAFQRALPELPFKEIFWRAHFAIGAMLHTMRDQKRLVHMSQGLCDPSDVDSTIERLVQFGAAGMRAPLSERLKGAEATTEVSA